METLTSCPVCGSANFHPYVHMVSGEEYYLCECGAAFLSPRMEQAELDRYYTTGAYRAQLNDNEAALKQQEEHAAFIAGLVKDFEIRSHLDIGCSSGLLLKAVGAKYQAGVDPDPVLSIKGKTIALSLQSCVGQSQLITCIHTLEHVAEPVPFLACVHEHLEDGGLLIVEVPNRRAWIAAYHPPQHVIAYDVASLNRLMSIFKDPRFILHGYGSPLDENITVIATK